MPNQARDHAGSHGSILVHNQSGVAGTFEQAAMVFSV
jgi:hypothetical protein